MKLVMHYLNRSVIALLLVSCSSLSTAKKIDPEMEELLSMDFANLLLLPMASKRVQEIDVEPGIVRVISQAEIQAYGARHLRDVLDKQTSMQIIGSHFVPHNTTSLRASASTQEDDTILILINGRPISSTKNYDIYQSFPLSSLKQIEIMRGPGTILHGAVGSINLVTHDVKETPLSTTHLSSGDFGYEKKSFNINKNIEGFDLTLTISEHEFDNEMHQVYDSQASLFYFIDIPPVDYQTSYSYKNALSTLKFNTLLGDFKINSFYSDGSVLHARPYFDLNSVAFEPVDDGLGNDIGNESDIIFDIELVNGFESGPDIVFETEPESGFDNGPEVIFDAGSDEEFGNFSLEESSSLSTLEYKRHFFDLGYVSSDQADWQIYANLSYLATEESFLSFMPSSDYISNVNTDTYIAEANTSYQPRKNIKLLLGGRYTYRKALVTTRVPFFILENTKANNTIRLFYSQLDYGFLNHFKLISGIQYGDSEDESLLSPRISLITQINTNWNSKLLYRRSYRQHSITDDEIFTNTLLGSSTEPWAKFDVFDAQLNYIDKKLAVSITYFNSSSNSTRPSDPLTARGILSQFTYLNFNKIHYSGLEFEIKSKPTRAFQLDANITYQKTKDSAGTRNVTYAPKAMIKTGFSYATNQGLIFSLFNSYFSASALQNNDEFVNFFPLGNNPEAKSYHLLNANVSMQAGIFLNNTALNNIRLSLSIDNLLDEEIWFPSIQDIDVLSLPHHAGRSIYFNFSYRFK